MKHEILNQIISLGNQIFATSGVPKVGKIDEFENPGSTTYRIELFHVEEMLTIYVKTLIPDHGVTEIIKEDVHKEYEILSILHQYFANMAHISVVRPIVVFPEHGTIVTEEAPGPTLQHRLAKATRIFATHYDLGKAIQYCYLAGKWLNEFQKITYKGISPFSANDLVRYCDVRLCDLGDRHESGINDILKRKILDYITKKSRQAIGQKNVVAGCHNDYAPHNMISWEGRLCVLDLGCFNYDSTTYDVCRFLHRLEIFKANPLVSNVRISDLQESFLLGYEHKVDRDSSVFKLAEIRFILSSMCTLLKGRTRSLVKKKRDLHTYGRYLNWLKQQCGLL